jgi:hypothetical protein
MPSSKGGQYAFITKAVLIVVDPYDVMHLSISSRLSKGIKLWQQGLREGDRNQSKAR